jgi:fructose/tagatose bisphosphate aldolase
MPLVPFLDLMRDAARGKYAVGYFESWNLESLLAVADAAKAVQSPVLLGFSGIYLPHPQRRTREHLQDYFAFAHSVASRLTVPTCLVFNESPHLDWVHQAIDLDFGLVMYSPESSATQYPVSSLQSLASRAHEKDVAIEAEMEPLEGVGGELQDTPDVLSFVSHRTGSLTNAINAREFVAQTNIDALAVNVGQVHMHGRKQVRLDLERLREIRGAVTVPLVLHGATSVHQDDLHAAIEIGVQKINVGSALKRVYFETLKNACNEIEAHYNPYEVMGSGLDADVLTAARLALQKNVEDWMHLFGSQDKTK